MIRWLLKEAVASARSLSMGSTDFLEVVAESLLKLDLSPLGVEDGSLFLLVPLDLDLLVELDGLAEEEEIVLEPPPPPEDSDSPLLADSV